MSSQEDQDLANQLRPAIEQSRAALEALDWTHGLTRNDMRAQVPHLPQVLYLHLPDSKRFMSADQVFHAALNALARANGEFFDEEDSAEMPSDRDLADSGAPPAWGEDTILSGSTESGTSATDTDGLDSANDELSDLEN